MPPHDQGAYLQRFVLEKQLPRPRVLATAAVVLVCTLILILSFGIERSLVRWNQTLNSLFVSEEGALWEGRVSIYRICWLSLPAAGWFGFGPGTFSIIFPFLQQEHGGGTQRHPSLRSSGLFADHPRMGSDRVRSLGGVDWRRDRARNSPPAGGLAGPDARARPCGLLFPRCLSSEYSFIAWSISRSRSLRCN